MSISARPPLRAQDPATRPRAEPHARFEEMLRRARRAEAVPGPEPSRVTRGGRRDEEPAGATAPAIPQAAPKLDPALASAELRSVLRAAPPAIAAAVRQGEPQVALRFGDALSVDLRAGAQGLEVLLRPDPRLAGAARVELPRLVEALRARGLRVARAGVDARGSARQAFRERVDDPAAVR